MKATFFNQPWLAQRYVPGHAAHAPRQVRGAQSLPRPGPCGDTERGGGGSDGVGEEAVAHYPATDGLSSTQILALVRAHADALADIGGAAAGAAASARAARGTGRGARRRCTSARMRAPRWGRSGAWRSRSCCWCSSPCCAGAGCGPPGRSRPCSPIPPSLSARWLSELLPFEPTGDQRRAMAEIDGDLALARPMQRLLMGEVGSGKTVVALYTLLRAIEHGHQGALMAPTETARRAALRDHPDADAAARRSRSACSPDPRPADGGPICSASSPPASSRCSSAPTR